MPTTQPTSTPHPQEPIAPGVLFREINWNSPPSSTKLYQQQPHSMSQPTTPQPNTVDIVAGTHATNSASEGTNTMIHGSQHASPFHHSPTELPRATAKLGNHSANSSGVSNMTSDSGGISSASGSSRSVASTLNPGISGTGAEEDATIATPMPPKSPAIGTKQPSKSDLDETVAIGSIGDTNRLSITSTGSAAIAIVTTVHDICLAATKRWLVDHAINRRVRTRSLTMPRRGRGNGKSSHRYQPYSGCRKLHEAAKRLRDADENADNLAASPSKNETGKSIETESTGGPSSCSGVALPHDPVVSNSAIPEPTNCLLKNMSHICDMLWRRAQREREEVPCTERIALETMKHLLEWAEMVRLGDGEEWALDEEVAVQRVVIAAKNLCYWLDDQEGVEMLAAIWPLDGE